jgi:hypothetical protein
MSILLTRVKDVLAVRRVRACTRGPSTGVECGPREHDQHRRHEAP